MDILDYFPKGWTPREEQAKILKRVQSVWKWSDVIIITASTAFGKEIVGTTIARWAKGEFGGGTTYLVPNNMLVNQVASNNPDFLTIKNKHSYPHPVAYNSAKRALKGNNCVLNYYQYISSKAYNDTLVCDESHTLVSHLAGFESIKLWGHLDGFESGQFRTTLHLFEWLENNKKSLTPRLKKARAALNKGVEKYIIEDRQELYRGAERDLIEIRPLSPRDNSPVYWPRSVGKIVMMSATFNDEDLYDLGLDRRRVVKIEAGSPIPVVNRPLINCPLGSMGLRKQGETLPLVVNWLESAIANYHSSKGFLHSTYSIAVKLQKALANSPNKDRFMFHTRFNKDEVFRAWRASPPSEGKVMIGCGMTEGIDLKGDLATWQAVLKAPFPDLTEPAIYSRMKERPDSYAWSALKQLIQSYGRVCRTPEDFGVTFFLDSCIERLIEENKHLLPHFFLEAWDEGNQ